MFEDDAISYFEEQIRRQWVKNVTNFIILRNF